MGTTSECSRLDSRISQLPEPIQHHILSFLRPKQVARAQVLSKAWRSIVQSRPVLDFLQVYFGPRNNLFLDHVNKRMQQVIGSIQRFSLRADFRDVSGWEANLDRWVLQSLEAKVSDLCLMITNNAFAQKYYVLPPIVFLSETIARLELMHCKLDQCSSVSLPNLLELTLQCIPALNQEMIEKFTSGCPNMEILRLFRYRSSSIRVSGLTKLIKVELDSCRVTQVEIIAPNLRVFKEVDSYPVCGDIHDTKIDLLACESTLRELSLSTINVTDEELRSLVSKFLRLEDLTLAYLPVTSIEISNQKLRRFKVIFCNNLERIDVDTTNLRVVKYHDDKFPSHLLNLMSFTSENIVDFYAKFPIYSKCPNMPNNYNEHLLKLGRFKNIKWITMRGYKHLIISEELDENFINMLSYLKDEFVIEVEPMRKFQSYEDMVNHLFVYSCYSENISIIFRDQQSKRNFLEVLSKKTLKETETTNRCNWYPTCKCWKHYLRHVETIDGERVQNIDIFKSFDATKYNIAHIKLERIKAY